jgi:hypothetical protein
MRNKQPKFPPILIGSANFANGRAFKVHQVNKRGACRITDKDDNISYAGSEAKAWASVRYMGKVLHNTERSVS